MQTRRSFIGTLSAGAAALALAGGALSLEGCMFSTIEADIEAYLPVALQAVDAILSLINPAAAVIVEKFTPILEAALAAITKAIADWQAAEAAQKPGFVGAIIATLLTIQTDLGDLLAAVQVDAPKIYGVVYALASIVLGVLQYFLNKLQGSPATKANVVHGIQVEPLHLSPKKFISTFNAKAVSLGHPEAQIR